MRVTEIFIVKGVTGIYEDRTEWIVDAWRDEASARARVVELTMLAATLNRMCARREWDNLAQAKERMMMHDPSFSIDTSGTHYRFISCRLKP